MIVVLGRPGLASTSMAGGRPSLHGLAAGIALAAARAGASVELVGSIGDDPEGDRVVVLLGQAGVGHAALLRDPAGHTPVGPAEPAQRAEPAEPSEPSEPTGSRTPVPRLEAEDVELGLRYLAEIRVLVLAEPLEPGAQMAAIEAAGYHSAAVVAVVPQHSQLAPALAEAGTVLEAPDDDVASFAELVGRYAAGMATGNTPRDAFAAATDAIGWERTAE